MADFDFTAGVLPAGATLTRASAGWYYNSSLVLTSAPADLARFTYDPTTGELRGLLVEAASTNAFRNSSATGLVPGTTGTLPTFWTTAGAVSGISRTIIGGGLESGIPYIDLRFAGTPTASSALAIAFEAITQIAASAGQDWVATFYARLLAGSLTNIVSLQHRVYQYDSGGANVGSLNTNFVPTSAALRTQRIARRTTTPAGIATIRSAFLLNYTLGNAVDLTIRLGTPQLELQADPTSAILTTNDAVTRAADVLTLALADGEWEVTVSRVSGDTTARVAVSGGAWTVPTSPSPLRHVTALRVIEARLAAVEAPDRIAIAMAPGWPASLPCPALDGYSLAPGSAVDRRAVEIGAPRVYRRAKLPPVDFAIVWQLDADQQAELDGLQTTLLREGANWFVLELGFPSGRARAVARFKGSVAMTLLGGERWQTTGTLELLQRPGMSDAELTALLGDAGQPPAWPEWLLPQPALGSWTLEPKPATVRTEDSLFGLPQQRQRSRNSMTEAQATWELTPAQAPIFEAFFRWRGRDGAQWFSFPFVQAIGTYDTMVRFTGALEWTLRERGYWGVSAPIEIRERRVLRFGPIADSAVRALTFLTGQQQTRTQYRSSLLVPNDPTLGRTASGTWTGSWTMPSDPNAALPYTPVLITGPLFFPIQSGAPATFKGRVDVPFFSMDGWAGRHDKLNPSPPPETIPDPDSVYANGGTNWGRYFVVGAVGSTTQFVAPIVANATWEAAVASAPAGAWSFQLVTYRNEADATADTNRILVGNPWRETERPGDVRLYYTQGYTPSAAQFTNVVLTSGDPYVISGTLAAFTATSGRSYQILVTEETDVEYAWALEPVAAAGSFSISRHEPMTGKVKLRLVEQIDGCSVRVVGQVWAEENAAMAATAWPDLRVEYRAIKDAIPAFPTSSSPALLSGAWTATLQPVAIGRVSLVSVNTKRIYGEYTMPSGLMRSFNVPPQMAGQTPAEVYYDQFNDTCFLYDQAVCLIAFLQSGRMEQAIRLVDALLAIQNPDGSYAFASDQAAMEAHVHAFLRIGAIAWVAYALLIADLPAYRGSFPTRTDVAAKRTLDFILTYKNALGLIDGGKGTDADPSYVIPWWSTEHNLDCWWCFDLADQLYGSAGVNYRGIADTIRDGLLTAGWDDVNRLFWQGGVVTPGFPVQTATWSSGQLTFTFAEAVGKAPGSAVTIAGVAQAGFNGSYVAVAGTAGSTVVVAASEPPESYVPPDGRPNGYMSGPARNTGDGARALDTHTWGAVALFKWGRGSDARISIDRAFDLYAAVDAETGLRGLTTFIPLDGYPEETVITPWYEGSFGGAIALRRKNRDDASNFMVELIRAQRADGGYLYALQNDPVNDIHAWPCVIAPAWAILAVTPPDGPNPPIFWT